MATPHLGPGVGDERRAVGEPRRPVQAAVLRHLVLLLRGLGLRVAALVVRARRAPRRVAAEPDGERRRPGRHLEPDRLALVDDDRAPERELDRLPEERRELL